MSDDLPGSKSSWGSPDGGVNNAPMNQSERSKGTDGSRNMSHGNGDSTTAMSRLALSSATTTFASSRQR